MQEVSTDCIDPGSQLIADIISYVEIAKQIYLSGCEKIVLGEKLKTLGGSEDKLKERAEVVILKDTYNTLAFQHWVDESDKYSLLLKRQSLQWSTRKKALKKSFNNAVSRKIEAMISDARSVTINKKMRNAIAEYMGAQAESSAQIKYENELYEKARQGTAVRIRNQRAELSSLQLDERITILTQAKKDGVIKFFDSVMVANLHCFADKLYAIAVKMGICPCAVEDVKNASR